VPAAWRPVVPRGAGGASAGGAAVGPTAAPPSARIVSPYFAGAVALPPDRKAVTASGGAAAAAAASASAATAALAAAARGAAGPPLAIVPRPDEFIPRVGAAAGRPGRVAAALQYGPRGDAGDMAFHTHLRAALAAGAGGAAGGGAPLAGAGGAPPAHLAATGGAPVTRTMLQVAAGIGAGAGGVVGQLDTKFIVAVAPAGADGAGVGARQLLIVDQHAADERVRLELLEDAVFGGGVHIGVDGITSDIAVTDDGLGVAVVPPPHGGGGGGGGGVGAGPRVVARHLSSLVLSPAQPLDLTPRERYLVRAHAGVLEAWGFRVSLGADDGATGGLGEGGGGAAADGAAAAALAAVPQLFDVVLTAADLRDFLVRLGDAEVATAAAREASAASAAAADTGGDAATGADAVAAADGDWRAAAAAARLRAALYRAGARPPAVARVLNSKACRGAVMFGDALPRATCSALLLRLSAARLPFQCAHGRPSVVPLVALVGDGGEGWRW
jgi:hypothetical protein